MSGRLVGDYGRFWPADWSVMTVAWPAAWSAMTVAWPAAWSAMTVAWLLGRSAMTVAWMAGWSVMRGDGLIGLVGDEEQWVMGDGWPADRLQG